MPLLLTRRRTFDSHRTRGIPQQSIPLMQLAVDSLAVYAAMCKYFVVIAPNAVHENTNECNLASYARRGWCRLEQWARMTAGFTGMYLATDSGFQPFEMMNVNSAMRVFEGDFTVSSDKNKLLCTTLGLWARIVQSTETDPSSDLMDMREHIMMHQQEIFPPDIFGDLPNRVIKVRARRLSNARLPLSGLELT
jgi:hypothetical protein